jgi:hypothetical protein
MSEPQWQPIGERTPDFGQPIRLKAGDREEIGCCHGYDCGGGHEWRTEQGHRFPGLFHPTLWAPI